MGSLCFARVFALGLLCLPLYSACQYDIDKIYNHESITPAKQVPADLVDLWSDDELTPECKDCARAGCKEESDACRDDAECLALTTCVSKARNPAEQNNCRALHTDWLREDIALRDVGGPYHSCVFQNECPVECGARVDLGCAETGYGWPKASVSTVALHLQLLEGQGSVPVQGARVRACQPENTAECVELSDGWSETDESGVVDLDVKLSLGTFLGYLEVDGGGLYPTLVQFGWPVGRDMTTRVTMVSEQNASFLINSVIPPIETPSEITDMRGFIQARVFSCSGIAATGVSFETNNADKYTQHWYTSGALIFPSFDATGTSELGAGGITSVLPGLRTLKASRDGELISTAPSPVRKGYMTIVFVVPGGAK